MRFSFDTSALIGAWNRTYPPDLFPSFWEQLERSLEIGQIEIHEEVLAELENKDDELFEWAKSHRQHFRQHDAVTQNMARSILNEFPRLVMSGKGRNQADPFVIALARAHNLVVVTEENGGSIESPRIPYVCAQCGVQVFKPVEFIRAMGWRF